MALNYLYMFEFVVDDLLITSLNECAPEEYPTFVEMTFRSQCYVCINDQESGGCMEATCRNGKCALFALDAPISENDQLFVHVYKKRIGRKCKFLLGYAVVPVYEMFKKVTRHFHEENPTLVMYLGLNLDEGIEQVIIGGPKNGNGAKNGNGKRKSEARKKGGQEDPAAEPAKEGEPAAEGEKPAEGEKKDDAKPDETKKSVKPAEGNSAPAAKQRKEPRPCPIKEYPLPPEYMYKTDCQRIAIEAQAARDRDRLAYEREWRALNGLEQKHVDSDDEATILLKERPIGDTECHKEPMFVTGCTTEMYPRQEEYCPTAEISKKLLALLHCNGKQTGNIVLVIRLSCMGPCIVSPFIFGKNSLCQPPLCAPDCTPAASMPCDKKKGKAAYPGPPNPPTPIQAPRPSSAMGPGSGAIPGTTTSCCPQEKKKCCKPSDIKPPIYRFFNCDPCSGCPFGERPCDTPNCANRPRSSNPCNCKGDNPPPVNPCVCFEKKKKKGKKGKREKGGMDKPISRLKGGMDSVTTNSALHLKACSCDECQEMDKMGRFTGGCNICDCEPEPEPIPEPICPEVVETNVIKAATHEEEGNYDEFEANLNGTGIVIRVLKDTHTVTDVLESENENDSGCEISDEICGKKKPPNPCPDDIYKTQISKRIVQARTGGKIENNCNIPLVRGNIKYSENERCLGDYFEIPASSIPPCETKKADKISKYRRAPPELVNCCLQVAGENIDNTMKCANIREPKKGIEVCQKKCVDENSDVFLLRLGKKQNTQGKKKLIELELKTPKEPIICPKQFTTVFTHVDEKTLDAEMGNKGKKGKKGKGKKKKK